MAFPGPLSGSFFITTLMMLASTAVIHMQWGLIIQALDVIEGSRGAEHKNLCDAPSDHPWVHLPLYKGDLRALIVGLGPYSSHG